MRYIGNKTRLLSFILRAIDKQGIAPGRAHDAFAGTGAVGRALKTAGWRVVASDLMTYSYVLQRAYVVASRTPSFTTLMRHEPELRAAVDRHERRRTSVGERGERHAERLAVVGRYLANEIEDEHGFVSKHFAPDGGRMYFTQPNAARIDAARQRLHAWHHNRWISDDAYYLLLAALIEGADRVANTAGVYAAFIKQWQPNATRPLEVIPQAPIEGRGSRAEHAEAAQVARDLRQLDLLYIDPPYNTRQYPGYYHVPELIARGWFETTPVLRGKTGLLPADGQRSAWCSRRRAPDALRELLAATSARHVLVSYNSEGVIAAEALRAILADASVDGKVKPFTRRYRRYRADSDHERRRYRGDWVNELLYHARLR
jgi:adenine-specific DNA-methyltransferase